MKSLNLVGLLHNFTSQIFKQFQVISFRTNRPGILDMKRERLILKLFSDDFPFFRSVIQFGEKFW